MIAAVRLGLRLAGLGITAGVGRVRSTLVALTGAVGTVLMLGVLAIANAETGRSDHGLVSDQGVSLLLVTVAVTVALPVLVLAATAGRLAAAMRDRRLANLRLLGLSPALTRVVAAVETGVAATIGALIGWVVFLAGRPVLATWHPAGRGWTTTSLTPTVTGYLLVLLAVPAAVTLVALSPTWQRSRTAVDVARRSGPGRRGLWRLVPLLIGTGLATFVLLAADPGHDNDQLTLYMFAAIIALGLGMILVVPVFVRLIADTLVRRTAHPSLLIAGRRLQDQPAAATRLVAGLLIGLFLVTGARAVVVAFEQTPQYQTAAVQKQTGQIATFYTSTRQMPSLRDSLNDVSQIRTSQAFPVLKPRCSNFYECSRVLVGSCAQLTDILGPLPQCRDDQPAWLHDPTGPSGAASELSFGSQSNKDRTSDRPVTVPTPTYHLPDQVATVLEADIFLPRSIPGIAPLVKHRQGVVLAVAKPGVNLTPAVINTMDSPTDRHYSYAAPDPSYYNFVAGLRQLVWAIAAVVLSIGLLGFAIGAIDRTVNRRGEMVSLQLTGAGPGLLRRTQLVEIALPLILGLILAIGLGALAGATYLAFGDQAHAIPWHPTLLLAGISTTAAAMVAALTLAAASPRIRPDLIRTE